MLHLDIVVFRLLKQSSDVWNGFIGFREVDKGCEASFQQGINALTRGFQG